MSPAPGAAPYDRDEDGFAVSRCSCHGEPVTFWEDGWRHDSDRSLAKITGSVPWPPPPLEVAR